MDEKGWKLDFVLNTHEHPDHTSGNAGLVKRYGCTVYSHPGGIGKIPHAAHPLKKADRILSSEKEYLEILDTPGHTFCHVCILLVENQKPTAIFTGDTLFNAGVGNCHRGGEPQVLAKTVLEQFYPMAGEILLYPGHDYMETNLKFTLSLDPSNSDAISTLEECSHLTKDVEFLTTDLAKEKKINAFLQCDKPSSTLRENVSKKISPKTLGPSPEDLFVSLRSLRDQW
ncbi:MBL fold metallo-hydrolase [Leptospira kmetyi]|uniref:hydroxyacylglutathione hydrolase n=1 Tax=Leptospira kmetyi TaxID=408139 RepID=A0AAD0XP08_9LEPT|nr:hydroxyacylglutathione hydrolase C-terminal domain-containing protein [Leptospira kmetyi]AYV54251.1 MBL fold metallo-hydrolase [Leptospira kmetyi]